MPSDERKQIALDAIRPRIEQFHSALAVTTDQVRGLLAGSNNTEDDQSEALGFFAKGKVNIERFASIQSQGCPHRRCGRSSNPCRTGSAEIFA